VFAGTLAAVATGLQGVWFGRRGIVTFGIRAAGRRICWMAGISASARRVPLRANSDLRWIGGRVYNSSRLTVASVCAVGSLAHRARGYKQARTALACRAERHGTPLRDRACRMGTVSTAAAKAPLPCHPVSAFVLNTYGWGSPPAASATAGMKCRRFQRRGASIWGCVQSLERWSRTAICGVSRGTVAVVTPAGS